MKARQTSPADSQPVDPIRKTAMRHSSIESWAIAASMALEREKDSEIEETINIHHN